MRHSPALELARATLLVDKRVAKFSANRDVCVAKLFETDLVHFAVVFDQFANDLQLVVRTDIEVGLHSLDDRLLEILRIDLEHDLEREPLEDG